MEIPVDQMEIMEQMKAWQSAELHPDLVLYVEPDESFGASLRHPLVYSIPMMLPGRLNEQYSYKRKALIVAASQKDWHTYVFLHERPYRLDALIHISETYSLSNKKFWELVGSVWTDSENIYQNVKEWQEVWATGRPNHQAAMTKDERLALAALPDELTIYRGAREDLNEDGLSWTTDRARAEWFAKRFNREGDAVVLEARVTKHDVLAYFTGRNESEVVTSDCTPIAKHYV